MRETEENSFLIPKEFNVIPACQLSLPNNSENFKNFELGCGATANVYKVLLSQNGKFGPTSFAALKQFKSKSYGSEQQNEEKINKKLKNEASYVNQLNHLNIVKCLGVCYENPFRGLIFELCNGSLSNLCHQAPRHIPMKVLVNWALQISHGMSYLAEIGFLHRDLKPENVLVKEKVCFCCSIQKNSYEMCSECGGIGMQLVHLKITDFGVTRRMVSVKSSVAGTYIYLAPEAFSKGRYSEYSDVWSFGVVLWEIISQEYPNISAFEALSGTRLKIKEYWPERWTNIMRECWDRKPKERPKFENLVEFFEEYKEKLKNEQVEKKYEYKGFPERKIMEIEENEEMKPSETSSSVSVFENSARRKVGPKIVCSLIFGTLFLLISGAILFYFSLEVSSIKTSSEGGKFFLDAKNCSTGYKYFPPTGFCYKPFVLDSLFTEANETCHNGNAELTSIHSDVENEFVINEYIKSLEMNGIPTDSLHTLTCLWIGLYYDEPIGLWRWTDRSTVNYTKWAIGEPNFMRNEHWTYIVVAKISGWVPGGDTWNNVPNSNTAGFVCKKRPLDG